MLCFSCPTVREYLTECCVEASLSFFIGIVGGPFRFLGLYDSPNAVFEYGHVNQGSGMICGHNSGESSRGDAVDFAVRSSLCAHDD